MHQWKRNVVALGAAALVAACGGGGSDTTTKVNITSVKVMGDSLADVGTFGYKFTVQGTDSLVFPQRVAASYGISSMCNYYAATSATTFVVNPAAGCTNYAIGGGRINNYSAPTAKTSITQQMQDATATANLGPTELALIDGGGNDAADLVGAYLRASADGGATFKGLLKTLLDAATVDAAAPAAFPALGVQYMTAVATKFTTSIDTSILGKGAQYVAVLNMPGITNTPRFQMVLGSIAAAAVQAGAVDGGAQARGNAEALFKGWIEAFNGSLATHYAGNSKVVVVDFYTSFNEEVAIPEQYSLTNVKTPACPAVGVGTDGLPVYDFPTCTATALSAAPPAGVTDPNWWKTYAFSDGFHPTPYAHQLLGQLVARSLATKGWL